MRLLAAGVVLFAALVSAGSAGAAGPVVSYTVTAGTQGANGWYTSAVTAALSVQGATDSDCPVVKTFHSSSDELSCSATDGTSTVQFQLQFKIDTDAPTVTAATPDRAPDAGGWYNHPLTVAFSGSDPTSGIANCTSATYSGPDSATASVTGTCTDNAGNVSQVASLALKYDATPPTVTATLSRKPDSDGWYSHPVTVTFSATDPGSGVGSCTAPVTYSGPGTPKATITGGCVDVAGNAANATATVAYDSTPPKLDHVAVAVAGRGATLSWRQPSDTAVVSIVRTPGRNGRRGSRVYDGHGSRFDDTRLVPGVAYTYTITSRDRAGNVATTVVKATAPALYAPTVGAQAAAGTLLRWAAVKGASYYNVQLYRGRTKVLSAWPARPQFRLHRTWAFGGRRFVLAPGRYHWYVWPGKGPLKAARYGALLGGSAFVVR